MSTIGSTEHQSALTIYMPLIVGLAAVAGSLIANAILELFKEGLIAKRRRRVSAACLIAELQIRLNAARGGIRSVDEARIGDNFSFVVPEAHPFYTAHVREIGLLGRTAAAKVVTAYAQIEASAEFLSRYAVFTRLEGRLFAAVEHENGQFLRQMNQVMADRIESALTDLRKIAN